ncbi:MAG: cytochrome P450 [Anaerolineae bacterium]|jgi:cytochrome P450 PksS|nr:cytochrome P450 [Anaerolineae bacterium]
MSDQSYNEAFTDDRIKDPFGILTGRARANPQAIYAQVREKQPVHAIQVGETRYWVTTRYDDCITVLKNPQLGKEYRTKLPPELVQRYPSDPTSELATRSMLFVDPPDHTRLRGLVHKAFTPRMIENLRPRIQGITQQLIDQMGTQGELDLIDQFAFPLPIIVIAELLGIPTEERDQFRAWTKAMLFGFTAEVAGTAALEFMMYFHGLFDQRRNDPKEDLISGLLAVEENGQKLNQEELMAMVFLLLVAGHETTVNLIGNGMLALIQNRDQLDKLRSNPHLIDNAIEEMLRYDGPVECATNRWAFSDVELGGMKIELGDVVLASLVAANRDPAVFPDPDRFDIEREGLNKHIAFGNGIHYCLGAPLARLEGQIAVNALVQHFPQIELAVSLKELRWTESLLLHGMKQMPVRY